MEYSICEIPRAVRRRLQTIVRTDRDGNYRRRANAILLLNAGEGVSEVARSLCAARSTIQDWRGRYEQYGEAGLVPEPRGPKPSTVTEEIGSHIFMLVEQEPSAYGYLRSRWTTEMLAQQVHEDLAIVIHASTVRRLLPKLGIVWNRARPTLCIKDRTKRRKMKAINDALAKASDTRPVFYVDEVDIDLNPRMGHGWMKKGQQSAIPTPGKNHKRYLAGALNATTGNVVWAEEEKKNSYLFILLLVELRKRYRQAKKIILIADNYIIHKSAMTQCFLKCNPKFQILFQPAYHPWVNKIELLWKQLHDTVTRNHRYSTINKLMEAVRTFMHCVSPYPGSGVSLAEW